MAVDTGLPLCPASRPVLSCSADAVAYWRVYRILAHLGIGMVRESSSREQFDLLWSCYPGVEWDIDTAVPTELYIWGRAPSCLANVGDGCRNEACG
jgi:hypothetical protein